MAGRQSTTRETAGVGSILDINHQGHTSQRKPELLLLKQEAKSGDINGPNIINNIILYPDLENKKKAICITYVRQ